MTGREKGLLVFIFNGTGPDSGARYHSGMGCARSLKELWLHALADTSTSDATVLQDRRGDGIMPDVKKQTKNKDKTIGP